MRHTGTPWKRHCVRGALSAALALLSSFGMWTEVLRIHNARPLNDAGEFAAEMSAPVAAEPHPAAPAEPFAGVSQQHIQSDALQANLNAGETVQPEADLTGLADSPDSQRSVPEEMDDALSEWGLEPFATISIPKIGVRAPVYMPSRDHWDSRRWDMLEEQMQVGLAAGAVAYPHSVMPGRKGTLFIAGHSSPPTVEADSRGFGHLFRRLPELREGDIITIVQGGGRYVDYEVHSTTVVSSTETSILEQQNDDAGLTLMTCYPVGTTRDRWVVSAHRVDGD